MVYPVEVDRFAGGTDNHIASAVGALPEVDTGIDTVAALADMENRIVKAGNSSLLVVEAERAEGPVVLGAGLDSEFQNNKG